LALKTTRDRRFDEIKAAILRSKQVKTKAGKPAKQIAVSRQNEIYSDMSTTTTFDFLYRLRIRSNYRDADTFLSGNFGTGSINAFYEDLASLARCSLQALETITALALGEKWFGSAVHEFSKRGLPAFAHKHSVLARWPEFI